LKPGPYHRTGIAVALIVLFLVLSYGFLQMPLAGSQPHPAYNEVALRYLFESAEDTNAPNVVNAIITDYRAFDTLGEATVLFVSITAVATVLISGKEKE
jgi:multisubunit Na+/H+ antiporter MnhB subunit